MFAYVTRRILIAIPTLLLFSMGMFWVLYSTGDPIARLRGGKLDADVVNQLIQDNGFNDPFLTRYLQWIGGFVRGDWGTSFQSESSAFTEITDKLPATLELLGIALVVTLVIAIPVGILGATHRYSVLDNTATGFSYLGFAMPTFFVGLLLQLMAVSLTKNGWGAVLLVPGVVLMMIGLFPFFASRKWGTLAVGAGLVILGAVLWRANQGEALFFTGKRFTPFGDQQLLSVDHLQHLVLPVITITVITIATWSRYLRSSMLDVLSQDYLRTARAKGLSERRVIYRHALRNAAIPLITILAIDAAALFQGAVITETVFSWDGIGSLLVESVREQDIPVAMGIVMLGAVMVVVFNLLADIAYSVTDPRIRLS